MKKTLIFLLFIVATTVSLLGVTAAFADDETALALFEKMNSQDLDLASIAIKKAHSPDVKQLAQMIIEDHQPIGKEAKRLGESLKLHGKPNAEVADKYANDLNKLKTVKGGVAFDKSYMDYELAFSKDFIRALKEEIVPNTQHEELKNFYQGVLPQFETHLMHIQHVAGMQH